MRIAVVQQNHNPGQVAENREKAFGFARQALAMGAEIICFHEEMLIGYHPDIPKLAEPLNGPTTQGFIKLLQGTGAKVIYGLTERDGDACYITAPIVSENGVVDVYRKAHLFSAAQGLRHEPTFYRPGNRLVAFEHGGARFGVLICYDGDFPEMFRSYARMGCAGVFWLNNRDSRGHAECQDAARRNSLIIAATCCCGKNEEGRECEGQSNITDSDGKLLVQRSWQEGIEVADVDCALALVRRQNNIGYVGHRPELYYSV